MLIVNIGETDERLLLGYFFTKISRWNGILSIFTSFFVIIFKMNRPVHYL
jgi:hypothetical protein